MTEQIQVIPESSHLSIFLPLGVQKILCLLCESFPWGSVLLSRESAKDNPKYDHTKVCLGEQASLLCYFKSMDDPKETMSLNVFTMP